MTPQRNRILVSQLLRCEADDLTKPRFRFFG